MASIKTGSIVADISGKIGNEIYSRNRAGLYVRSFTSPVQPNSVYQLAARQLVIDANLAWNNLSELDYSNWLRFSENFKTSYFNDSRLSVDPRSFFIKCYIYKNRTAVGGNPIPEFPTNLGFESVDIDFSDPIEPRVILNGGSNNSAFAALLYSDIPQSPGVRSLNSIQKLFYGVTDYIQGTPLNPSDLYTDRFAGWPVLETKRMFFQAKIIHKNSGLKVGQGWNNKLKDFTPDPYTLGYPAGDGAAQTIRHQRASLVTTTLAGTIFGISLKQSTTGGNIQVGIYAKSGANATTLLASSNSLPVGPAGVTTYYPLTSPFAAAAATSYFIGAVKDTNSLSLMTLGGPTHRYDPGAQYPLQNPFGTQVSQPHNMSFSCEVVP
jgi:hypothetical protein